MLKRVLTGLVAAAALIALVLNRYALGGLVFQAVVFFMLLVSQKEMIDALRVRGYEPRSWAVYLAGALLIPAYLLRGSEGLLAAVIAGFTLALCASVFSSRKGPGDVIGTMFPLVYPTLPVVAIALLARMPTPYDLLLLVALFLTSISSDVFALMFGRLFGRHKLIPSVSPNKTWEGAIGALVATITVMVIFGAVYNYTRGREIWAPHFIAFGAVGSIATQMGDLVASSIKRYCGIKDFGNFFPGHGGALDRMDGMLINAMVLLLYAYFTLGSLG